MLEVLYETETKEVRGWCADPKQFNNFSPKLEQDITILPINLEDILESDDYWVDLPNQTLLPNPDYEPPKPPRNLGMELDELKARVGVLEIKKVS